MISFLTIVSPDPFKFEKISCRSMLVMGIITLLPQLFFLGFYGDYAALYNIFAGISASFIAELFENLLRKRKSLGDLSFCLSGIISGMFMPMTFSPYFVFFCVLTAVGITRVFFGGKGSCWFNSSMVAVAVAYLCADYLFPATIVNPATISQTGSAFSAFQLLDISWLASDKGITSFINSSFLGNLGIKLPEGYITLFWNMPSLIPAFKFNLLTLAGSVVLLALNIIDWIVPACFIVVYSALVWFFSNFIIFGFLGEGDILFSLLTGGTLFTAFYVLTDYSSLPLRFVTKMVYGALAGVLAFLMNGAGGSSVGSVFTVLIMNMFSPLLHRLEDKICEVRMVKRVKTA